MHPEFVDLSVCATVVDGDPGKSHSEVAHGTPALDFECARWRLPSSRTHHLDAAFIGDDGSLAR